MASLRDSADTWQRILRVSDDTGANEVQIIMTKDADLAEMVDRLGPPPHVIRLTCGPPQRN